MDSSFAGAQMLTPYDYWRSHYLVAREHGGSGRSFRRQSKSQIGLAAGFESGGAGREKKSLGQVDHLSSLTSGIGMFKEPCCSRCFSGKLPLTMAISSQA